METTTTFRYWPVTRDEISASDLLAESANEPYATYYRGQRGNAAEGFQAVYFPTQGVLGIAWGSDADYYAAPSASDIPAAIQRWVDGDEPDA